MTIRSGTSWIQIVSLQRPLALWNDGGVTGPSQDTVFDLYSPGADRWWRALSATITATPAAT